MGEVVVTGQQAPGMAARVAAVDWSATPLGPADHWPQSLQTALSICLSSRFPLLVWWGPQLTNFYNDAYLPLLGIKHPAALGQPASQTWAEAWDELGPMADRVLAGRGATFAEDRLLFLQRHGYVEESYWTFSYSPITDESGGIGGVFVAVSDTTNRVIGEQRLRILRDLGELSSATAGTTEEVCRAAVDVIARHRASVPFALAYVRDEAGELRLAAGTGIRPGSDAAPATLPAQGPWRPAGGEPVGGLRGRWDDWAQPGPLGDAVPDQALVFPLTQAGEHEPIGLLVLGVNPYRALDRDYRAFFDLAAGHVATAVTDALAYQAERRRAEALAELDRAKTDFFSNVSHEFRTPLTLIMGPLAELRERPEVERDASLREELDVIARNAGRLGKLVNTLLDFSRLQSGRIDARFRPVDLAAFTTELASVFRSAIARAGLDFTVDCPPLPAPVHVDRDMWEKVVLNLLSNAMKYTFTGGITVRLRPDEDAAVLTVADTGTGIPAEELPRLFERFHRVPHARARSGEGSGIGLAMVRELVTLHGGTITADSAPGLGTAFDVRIPWGSAHLPADQLADGDVAREVSPAVEPFLDESLRWLAEPEPADRTSTVDPAATRGTVLVADDNADMREYLARLLTPRYSVRLAPDGDAALVKALADPPDLVVSDVMMSGLDGMQLLAALRGDERTARVPVVLLSARAGQESSVEGLAAGADDYLVKPFAAEELLARVDAHLQLGRARRGAEERFRAMADRLALLQRVTADLSAASTPVQVAEAAVGQVRQVVGDVGVIGFFEVDPQQRVLRRLAVLGSEPGSGPDEDRWTEVPLTTPLAITTAATSNRPLWPEDLLDGTGTGDPAPAWLHDVRGRLGIRGTVALPLTAFGRVVGVIGMGLSSGRQLEDADRGMLLAIAEQCAQALDRARLYRAEQRIAETLQHSLLPQRLPSLERLSLAARYLPGAEGTQAGGDWYDVVDLDDRRVAIAVGDVVGQGPAAAAVMGQLRSALSAALLQGLGPAAALEALDRFAARLPGATASSAACLVLDWSTGELRWSRAGHLPALLMPGGAESTGGVSAAGEVRVLDGAGAGTVLGIGSRPPFTEGRTTIRPGDSLLLYTDGLVERRGQPIDAGIRRLLAVLDGNAALAPEPLATEILRRALSGDDQPDDVALIVARLLPAPIAERLPARPDELAALRRRIRSWADAHGLPPHPAEDLQLALGEAVSNSVEHAYRGRPEGTVEVHLTASAEGGVHARIRDFGRWHTAPVDKGFRGRGLEMIHSLADNVVVDTPDDGAGGTLLTFSLPPPASGGPAAEPGPPDRRPARPLEAGTALAVHTNGDGVRLEIEGELDLATATAMRPALMAELAAASRAGGAAAVDLRRTTYLASAGLGLLLELAEAARSQGLRFRVLTAPAGTPARVLALAGLDALLRPLEGVSPAE